MNKKEKYYNYVVEDIVKNTEIDYDQEKIKYPFFSQFIFFNYYPFSSNILSMFSNHVRKVYGVHSEEIQTIWKLYKEKIQSLIK
tara:strand:+ start:278 stop:529 length:252 start_codon:yes stop_codon:yes gene_type:complete